jgi:hypothetical protein
MVSVLDGILTRKIIAIIVLTACRQTSFGLQAIVEIEEHPRSRRGLRSFCFFETRE